MNLILLAATDFVGNDRVRLHGRVLDHATNVHRAVVGDMLRVGLINGQVGRGQVERIDDSALEMQVQFDADPPAPLPLRLVLALPRPKVLNRSIAAAVSMGIKEIDLINAWRVEKAYWKSPRLSEENLRLQSILGLEQAGDTTLPVIRTHRFFTPFVREELPRTLTGRLALVAHPAGETECPRGVKQPVTLVVGPEGGFIEREVAAFRDIGCAPVRLGSRILRVETALAFLIGRLF